MVSHRVCRSTGALDVSATPRGMTSLIDYARVSANQQNPVPPPRRDLSVSMGGAVTPRQVVGVFVGQGQEAPDPAGDCVFGHRGVGEPAELV
jgi:hypothetical protein